MHGLVHAQALDVGPVQDRCAQAGHLAGIVQRGELDKLCFALRVDALDQLAQRKANPGYDDRPSFDAAVAVDALFWRRHLEDGVYVEFLLLVDQAVDLYLPGTRAEILGQSGGFVLVRRKLVVVVLVGDVFIGSDGFGRAERTFLDAVNLVAGLDDRRWRDDLAQTDSRRRGRACNCRASEKLAPVQAKIFRSDLRGRNVPCALNEHKNPCL